MAAMQTPPTRRGRLKLNEPMSRHTSWRAGGVADKFYEPVDIEDMAEYLRQLPEDEPVMMVGLGSNLLVRDRGIRGSVICPAGLLDGFEILEGKRLRVEAGVPCAIVAKRCAKQAYTGLEFLAGIPGTVGGALAMNAGAFGGETWTHVEKVETLDRQGNLHLRSKDEYAVGYRSVTGPGHDRQPEWFVAAWFRLEKNQNAASHDKIKQLLARRSATQPTGLPSCGSVFRNPEGDHAARLIEACGLKGLRIGNAQVSEKHANFIINLGKASASDIEQLIMRIAEDVKHQTGVQLETEVRIVGEA